ncbi:MAG: anti-phage ZorAB system protein ZorA, partial [Casimicrobiaceae bacterium]
MNTQIDSLIAFWRFWPVGLLIAILLTGFLLQFFLPALLLGHRLKQAIRKLSDLKQRTGRNPVDLSELTGGLKATAPLAHAWTEYAKTLHPQKEIGADGQSRIVRWRATALAETFFTEHAIVHIPLKADFYKHLPGILTGLGIIGTFMGLIEGLSSFDVTDPTKAQSELTNLIHAVGHAFIVSATAITLAMLLTWLEKWLLSSKTKQLGRLRELIDSLFESGAGEEYLERIVRASETQATQAAQIKDALVADLRKVLTELSERQLEAQARNTKMMSQDVGNIIIENLSRPVTDLSETLKNFGAVQGEALLKVLTDVLADFSTRMQNMYDEQMENISGLLTTTTAAMHNTAARLAALAANIDTAGKRTVDAM